VAQRPRDDDRKADPSRPPSGPKPVSSTPQRSLFTRPSVWLISGVVLAVASLATWAVIALVPSGDDRSPDTAAPASGAPSRSATGSAGPSAAVSASPSGSPRPGVTTSAPVVVGPPVGGAWPNAGSTGVPAGVALSTYTGPCVVTTPNTVIDAKTINCDLEVRTANVTIKRSHINGTVLLDSDLSGSSAWSYTLVDSEVNAGLRQLPAVSYGNMTVLRSEIVGGATSVQCGEKAVSCTVQDSWLHGQLIPNDQHWHLGGFLSNGGRNIRIRHNTIICDTPENSVGDGCTGDLNLLGDFAAIQDVVVDSNYLGASVGMSFCLYGGDALSKPYPHANNVVVTNNVFARGTNGKCGAYGPVSSYNINGPGNVWRNNTWDGGGTVPPDM